MKNNPSTYQNILDSYHENIAYKSFSESDDSKYTPSKLFIGDFDVALAFYQKALQCYYKQDFSIATFMMQQAARLTYTMLLSKLINKRIKRENIQTLRKMVQLHLPDFKDVFPCNNDQEYHLLQQLENADINVKYSPDFNISEEEVLQLLERVEELIELSKETLQQKLSN